MLFLLQTLAHNFSSHNWVTYIGNGSITSCLTTSAELFFFGPFFWSKFCITKRRQKQYPDCLDLICSHRPSLSGVFWKQIKQLEKCLNITSLVLHSLDNGSKNYLGNLRSSALCWQMRLAWWTISWAAWLMQNLVYMYVSTLWLPITEDRIVKP